MLQVPVNGEKGIYKTFGMKFLPEVHFYHENKVPVNEKVKMTTTTFVKFPPEDKLALNNHLPFMPIC